MVYPAVTAMPEGFFAKWSTWYPDAPPVGFLLRVAYPDIWLRIHSLTGSKRYADSPSEYVEMLRRHNLLATEVLGGNEVRCAVLVLASCGHAPAIGDLPMVHRLSPELVARGEFAEAMCLRGGSCTWRAGAFDDFLRAIADDEAKGLIVELDRGRVYAPYDGGADAFFATTGDRDLARHRYRRWLSERADGL